MRIAGIGGVRGLLRSWLLAAAVASAVLAWTSVADAAPAQPAYTPAGSFGAPGSADGEFHVATRLAVEPATGNILVADSANSRVQVFAPDPATTGNFLTSISTGLGVPYGIAIDQSTGDVYVSESGTDQIVRYQSDGAPIPSYTLDPSFVSPAPGAAAGQIGSFASPIAVDPVTHDLLVADVGNRRVSRFTSAGGAGPSFDGADTAAGAFTNLLDVAVGPTGTIYVVDSTGDPANGDPSRIEQFSSTGVSQGALGPVDTPRSVAVDLSTGTVLVGGRSSLLGSVFPPLLYVFAGGTTPVSQTEYPGQFAQSQAVGLAVAGGSSHRVYGLTDKSGGDFYGTSAVQAFDPSAIPGVSVDAPSPVTATTAHLIGHVDPGGQATDVNFEYSVVGSSDPPGVTPDQHLTGSGEQPVTADITGLEPFTEYQVRLLADNGAYNASDVRTFITGQAPPRVVTEGATEIDAGGGVLNGKINPLGLQTTYVFEYGETTEYGRKLPAGAAAVAGNGHVPRAFARALRGLKPGTTYHFRIVATNSQGSSAGSDATFTTAASVLAPRSYEQVSAVDKGGATIDEIVGFQAKPDGDGLVFKTMNTGIGAESSPRFSRIASLRSSDGWLSRPLDAPTSIPADQTLLNFSSTAVSADLSRAFVISNHKLAGGGVKGNTNLYLRDVRSGTYTLVATIANPAAYAYYTQTGEQNRRFVGGAKDFSWILFDSAFSLIPGATHSGDQLYRWSSGQGLTRVSVLPDGSPSQGQANSRGSINSTGSLPEIRATSDDGREIVFSLSGAGEDGVYLRKDGTTTIPLSVSQVGGAPSTPEPGWSTGLSRDGRYATFTVASGTPLTDDAPGNSGDLYRYDVRTGQLEYLATADNPDPAATYKVSDDGSHVYFTPLGAGSISVWHDGALKHVASIAADDHPSAWAASPDGRYFAFTAFEALTSYDNTNSVTGVCPGTDDLTLHAGQCREVYVYDADTEELTCASCPADGGRSSGNANLPASELSLSNRYPRVVTDEGQVFFDTPSKLVSGDVNGKRDVYVYQDGEAALITPGTAPFDARFGDASEDGSNVFFVTSQALVGQDRDGSGDVYDARIGGGIPEQSPVTRAPCTGTECAEHAPGPVASSEAPSQLVTGKAGVVKPRPKPRISVVKSSFTRSAVRVTVRVTGRGRMRASGSRVVTTVRNASDVGSYTLTVPLSKKTRSAVRRRQRVKVSVKVSFTPPFSAAVSTKLSRTLGK